MNSEHIFKVRERAVLHDKKWQKLRRRSRLFRYIPFVDFILVAGSMATGEVRPSSDFDIIVAAQQGRMFTSRFFLIVALDFFRWRRKNLDHGEASADTICPNHFVTEARYKLSPPHGHYWRELYQRLVPLYGDSVKIARFYTANASWMGERAYEDDMRHRFRNAAGITRFFEDFLSGSIGDGFERLLRRAQEKRIHEKILPHAGYKPRLHISDAELELHLDTKRIEVFEGISAKY